MPISKYLKLTVGYLEFEAKSFDELPIAINYSLENPDNFQEKKSAQSLGLKVPATLLNDRAANTFRNVDVMDLTIGQVFKGNQKCVVEANGHELLVGKAFLNNASHTEKPQEYEFNLYGDNADWMVDLQEKTLYDFLKQVSFDFTKDTIINSWVFDGTDESFPYVFAPVRYRSPIGGYNETTGAAIDNVMIWEYFKPSLSIYWILYNAFKSLGYKIQSTLFDSNYFRRMVMPWTWGSFLDSEGTQLDVHKFLAKSANYYHGVTSNGSGRTDKYIDDNVANDSTDGAFDNNNEYYYDNGAYEMVWEYKAPFFGILEAAFSCTLDWTSNRSGGTSDAQANVEWYVNGLFITETNVFRFSGGGDDAGLTTVFFKTQIMENDPGNGSQPTRVSAKIHVSFYGPKLGYSNIHISVNEFKLDYLKVPLGGSINFENITGLKKYKFLDLLRGVVDTFNISFNTDNTNKVVVMEPTHPWSLWNDLSDPIDGYFKNEYIDWNGKEDLSKNWVINNYSDCEREYNLKFKDDGNDGILKTIQDRATVKAATGKYVFPERFKTGKKYMENRFFSATVHYEVKQWEAITGEVPQMVCIIPENISNTSNSESENTFNPKICFYKGNVSNVGGWQTADKDGTLNTYTTFPYMFSVNYKEGGENDPILSYCDEKIKSGSGFVLGKGLLKRFYWQRLAIMRNGQFYNTWFRLTYTDIANQLHREFKSYIGHKWQLIQINGYKPLQEGSTNCLLYKWHPVEQIDADNTYPSSNSVINGVTPPNDSLDLKYCQLKCLLTDIPT